VDIILQVIRNIHPVGQGAFYTETLHRPGCNDDKHIVYDCGAMPYRERVMVARIGIIIHQVLLWVLLVVIVMSLV
jgi:hypothetical protein